MTTIGLVNDSLQFAQQRLDDLKKLNNGNLAGATPAERQCLVEEFFLHLVSAIDKLMHVVNESRNLGMPTDTVTARKVFNRLMPGDPIKPLITQLHPDTQHNFRWLPLPSSQNPYTDESSHFRILVFRHWISHCGTNPFFFRVGSVPHCSLFLDPRQVAEASNHTFNLGGSKLSVFDELQHFLDLVNSKCKLIISCL